MAIGMHTATVLCDTVMYGMGRGMEATLLAKLDSDVRGGGITPLTRQRVRIIVLSITQSLTAKNAVTVPTIGGVRCPSG